MLFYIGLGLQLTGLGAVGLCLISGLSQGDYGRAELWALVGGGLTFTLGAWARRRA